jgi:hypothetical protein
MTLKIDLFDGLAVAGGVVAVAGLACWHWPAAVVAVGAAMVAGSIWGAKRYGVPHRPAGRRPDEPAAGGDA